MIIADKRQALICDTPELRSDAVYGNGMSESANRRSEVATVGMWITPA
jgi:hypothetical protein